jgi:hypothetical protein
MGTVAGVGFSDHRNPIQAGKEAVNKALAQAGIEKPDFVFVFATVGYNQPVLIRSIRETAGGAPLSGCSGEGLITQETVAETNFGVAVMVIASDELRFDNVLITELERGADLAGKRLASEVRALSASDNLACFLFADGLAFNFDPFLKAFEEALPSPLPLFGGLAADNWASQRTYQYHDNQVITGGIACVVLSGRGRFTWGIDHGCVPIGTRRTITRSQGNVIQEIDGIPALEALKDYFDEDWQSQWSKTSLNLCLGLPAADEIQDEYGKFIIRYMPSKDDQDGSVTIQSEVPANSAIWIVRRDKDLIRKGLKAIADRASKALGDQKPKFILQFECVGRGKVVFREQEKTEMIETLQQDIGRDIPWLGFYSYGEIGPIRQYNCFHNFTTVLLAVY